MSYSIALGVYNSLVIAEKLLPRIDTIHRQHYQETWSIIFNAIQDEIHAVQKGNRHTLPGASITSNRAIIFLGQLNDLLTENGKIK